jgi:hypothetical protein
MARVLVVVAIVAVAVSAWLLFAPDEKRGELTQAQAEQRVRDDPVGTIGTCPGEKVRRVQCRPAPKGWFCAYETRNGGSGEDLVAQGSSPLIGIVC